MQKDKLTGISLKAVRTWIQCNVQGGDRVTWMSNDKLKRDFTVNDLENIAKQIADAINNHSEYDRKTGIGF